MTNKEELKAYIEALTLEQMEKVFSHPLFQRLVETLCTAQKGTVQDK